MCVEHLAKSVRQSNLQDREINFFSEHLKCDASAMMKLQENDKCDRQIGAETRPSCPFAKYKLRQSDDFAQHAVES
jgi:hypothetical protein